MRSAQAVGTSLDDAAVRSFTREYGERARRLPPVAIVIAAHDEEGAIGAVLDALPSTLCGLDVAPIVVVDGSTDGTAAEARGHGALVCDIADRRGQGAALRLGYRIAREGGARYIVTTDADGQYDPHEAERVLAPVVADEADFVSGSRRLGRDETTDRVRRMGIRVFAAVISALTGHRITDPAFGLRAMCAEVTAAIELEQPQYQAAEVLIGVISRGFRAVERPATMRRRRASETKKGGNLLYGVRFTRVVVTTWLRERRAAAAASRRRGAACGAAESRGHTES